MKQIPLFMVEQFVQDMIDKNPNIIIGTFYEIRVKRSIPKELEKSFLHFAKIRLKNLDYDVYFTGDKYLYDDSNRTVQDNELIVAIKKPKTNEKNDENEHKNNQIWISKRK